MKYRHLTFLLRLLTAGAVLMLPACGPADVDGGNAEAAGEQAATAVEKSTPASGQQAAGNRQGGEISGINSFLAELYARADRWQPRAAARLQAEPREEGQLARPRGQDRR